MAFDALIPILSLQRAPLWYFPADGFNALDDMIDTQYVYFRYFDNCTYYQE